jgi:putative ATP-binding cassette transporter
MMFFGVFAVVLLNTFGQLRLNAWQGQFYNALERRDAQAVIQQMEYFLMIVGMLLVLVVAQTWLTETMKVRARLWLTQHMLATWLLPRRAYLLGFAGDIARNPDQRMGQDASLLTDSSIGFAVGLGQSTLLLVSFIGVLWQLSQEVVFTWGDRSFSIPGYMVWCALLFTGLGSLFTYLVGKSMISLNAQRYAAEGDFRTGLVRVSENAVGIALERGEADELVHARHSIRVLTIAMQALANARARLTWVTSGYGWLGLIVPIIVASPGYLSGNLSWGGLFMVINGFNQVQNALRWFIDNYAGIAEWQANLQRVVALLESLDHLDDAAENVTRIALREGTAGELSLNNLAVCLPGDLSTCVLVGDRQLVIKAGERLRFLGAPGSGKTTLFMALAGLWPWGRGVVVVPKPFNALFVPERPYLPPGTLREVITYPRHLEEFDENAVRSAMTTAGLKHLMQQLDVKNGWAKDLSLGDQQRLSIARILLLQPDWAVLDDSLSAIDEASERALLAALIRLLPGLTIIATSRTRSVDGFYQRTIELGGVASLPPFTLANGTGVPNGTSR